MSENAERDVAVCSLQATPASSIREEAFFDPHLHVGAFAPWTSPQCVVACRAGRRCGLGAVVLYHHLWSPRPIWFAPFGCVCVVVAGPGTAASPTRIPNNPIFQDTMSNPKLISAIVIMQRASRRSCSRLCGVFLRCLILMWQCLLFPIQRAARLYLAGATQLCPVTVLQSGLFVARKKEIALKDRKSDKHKQRQPKAHARDGIEKCLQGRE